MALSDESFAMDLSDDAWDEENKPSNKSAGRGAGKATKKKKKALVVMSSDEESDGDAEADALAAQARKDARRTSMERAQLSTKYQKKTQYEHIMLRPDTYIGSTEKITQPMWVFEDDKMVHRPVTFVPGLFKIFDEILVNAADNKQRDPNMKGIKVTIDATEGSISVWNDGKGIPVEMHREHDMYIPELIFGHLMTGENFEDTQERVVGGRNGYGAKLANIFSTKFVVETNDTRSGKRYRQEWLANMSQKGEPKMTKATGKDFTCITFVPDYARFGMPEGLSRDMQALMTKRVYDIAGVTDKSVKVHLNGTALKINTFDKYIDMYLAAQSGDNGDEDEEDDEEDDESDYEERKPKAKKKAAAAPIKKIYERVNDRWEVCIAASPDGQMQQVSFVNGICTSKGGQHVNYIADQVSSSLQTILKKKHKGSDFKPHQIKSHLWIFVNALIVNPAFDSQTKETLTTRSAKFGPKEMLPKISDKTLKQVEKSPIVGNVLFWAKAKEMRELSKKAGGTKKSKVKGVDKLDDANNAGGRNSQKCTLILTEGDSAKTLAISGLSVVGRDNYGVFPLRGKLLNVRDAGHKQILKNEEIQNIMKIMGLQPGKKYTDTKSLRYGHLLIMTDQDHDGSHIKGLLMNFLHHFWPSLLEVPGFLQVFITPIVKATKGQQTHSFYTLPEYDNWLESLSSSERSRWSIKYYKGLGTSTAREAKEYFANLGHHRLDMVWEGTQAADVLDMAFSKKRVADRKEWLGSFEPGTFLDYNTDTIDYKSFVNRELILFSMADNMRSIPSVVDGLKPSQRKVLFSCFKRKLKTDIKVAQLVGYVSEHSAYHHGEVSLSSTVVGMAQSFVGSNNVTLLYPSGQFGSRLLGGKDAASSRYIFTRLAPLARKVFHESDDALLEYLDDDGLSIEPEHYVPIVPLILVNGAAGIGTGWSTDIPCFNPRDLVAYIRRKLILCEPEGRLQPWYKGFDGEIRPEMHATKGFTGRYKVSGVFERDEDEEAVIITELPVGVWTQNYKQFLMDEKQFPEGFIKDIRENHTDTKVHFTVYLSSEAYRSVLTDAALRKKFRLETSLSTTNMHAFTAEGNIKKYDSPEEIIDEFFTLRLDLYAKRKEHLLQVLRREHARLDNKARFIQMVINGELVVTKRKKNELLQELLELGFEQFHAASTAEAGTDTLAKGFDYLLSMSLWTLTMERVEELLAQRDGKAAELEALAARRPEDLWEEDLAAFEEALVTQDDLEEDDAQLESAQRSKSGRGKSQAARKPRAKAKAAKIEPTGNVGSASSSGGGGGGLAGIGGLAKALPIKQEAKRASRPSDSEILSLSERLQANMMVSPAPPPRVKKRAKEPTPAAKAGATDSTPKPKAAADKKRRLRTVEKPRDAADDEDDEDFVDEEELLETKPAARSRPARQRKPATVYVDLSDSDNEDASPPPSEASASEEEEEEEIVAKPKKAAAAKPKKSAAAKVKVIMSSSDEDDDDDDDDDDEVSVKKAVKPAARKPAARKPAAKKKAAVPSSDEDDEDDEEEEVVAAPRRPARARAAARRKVVIESDEDGDEDDDFEGVDDEDDESEYSD